MEERWYCIQVGREFVEECPVEYCVGPENCPLIKKEEEDDDVDD